MLSLHRFHLSINAIKRGLASRRPVWMVSFSIEEASLSEGLRAASAATAMLLLGRFLHDALFAWAAIGAFWTCLADASGSSRRRFVSMMAFAVLSTALGGVTAFASGAGIGAAAAAILTVSFVAGLACVWSAAAYQVAILVATACVVMVDKPLHGVHDALALLGIYLGGCLFATVLSFTVWRIHPFAPSRYAARLVYSRLADLARDSARLLRAESTDAQQWARHAADLRAPARAAIEAARKALLNVPQSKSEGHAVHDDLSLALADAESIFGALIAVANVSENPHRPSQPERAARCLTAIAEVLQRMGRSLGETGSAYPHELRERLSALAGRLEFALGHALSLRFLSTQVDHGAAARRADPWFDAARLSARRAWGSLKANLSRDELALRHAMRLAAATTAAFLAVRTLHLPFGYWATMATLLILQPSIATTWPRGLERAAGSTAGAALAVAIGFLVHTPLAISLVVFPLVCLTMALRPVSYSLYVIFLTPTFVLVADFASPANEFIYAMGRLGNNILGCLIALLAAYILWPKRTGNDLASSLAGAVSANLAYLAAALQVDELGYAHCESMRRAAGLASNGAEEACKLARFGRTDGALDPGAAMSTLERMRRIAGIATRICATRDRARSDAALTAWVAAVSRESGDRFKGAPATEPLMPLSPLPRDPVEVEIIDQLSELRRSLGDLLSERSGTAPARRTQFSP